MYRLIAIALLGALLTGCMSLVVGGPRGGPGAEVNATDQRIVGMVNQRLADDPLVRATDISVTASRGVVTLRGSVHSDAARDRAINLARDVPDVARVVALELTVR